MTRDQLIADVIRRWEGGYSNDPDDSGGPTKFGITQQDYSEYLGRHASASDVKRMTIDSAINIYRKRYWDGAKMDLISPTLQSAMYDTGVNNGVGTAAELLQKTLVSLGYDVKVDGVTGPKTAAILASALKDHGARIVNNKFVDLRVERYHAIVKEHPADEKFLAGWIRRANYYHI